MFIFFGQLGIEKLLKYLGNRFLFACRSYFLRKLLKFIIHLPCFVNMLLRKHSLILIQKRALAILGRNDLNLGLPDILIDAMVLCLGAVHKAGSQIHFNPLELPLRHPASHPPPPLQNDMAYLLLSQNLRSTNSRHPGSNHNHLIILFHYPIKLQ